jgi:hypothetical protein
VDIVHVPGVVDIVADLDGLDAVRGVVVAFGQRHDAVNMLGEHDPGIDGKRPFPARAPHRLA